MKNNTLFSLTKKVQISDIIEFYTTEDFYIRTQKRTERN